MSVHAKRMPWLDRTIVGKAALSAFAKRLGVSPEEIESY